VPKLPTAVPTKAQPAISKIERMLALAPERDLWILELVRRRLLAHEAERQRTWPSRRTKLDALVAEDLERPCEGFKRLERAVAQTAIRT
jgi:hypothetical protein